MNDKYQTLRTALKAGPTPGPWRQHTYRIGLQTGHAGISSPTHCLFAQVVNEIHWDKVIEPDPANANYITACDPDTISALLQERDGLLAQHGRDSAELRRLCQERDNARKEAEHWKAKYLNGSKDGKNDQCA